jgi:ribosomal protein S18 acetylase RimI-like enzyme
LKFYDKTLRDFVEELLDRNLSRPEVASLLHKIETHQNSREAYWNEKTYDQHFLSDDRIFYTETDTAKSGNEMTSFILYRWIDAELEITHWAVKYKGCGEGGAVLSLFLSQIASRAYKITLECGEWNQSALKLYEAYHFEKTAFRPQYYRTGEGAWILERSHNS